MSNVPLMFQPLVKYADFMGRSRRTEFWLWILFRVILNMALGLVVGGAMFGQMAHFMGQMHPTPQDLFRDFGGVFIASPVMGLIQLALLIPTLAVGVRRLHDIGRTGWWLILPLCVGIVCAIGFVIICGGMVFDMASRSGHVTDLDGIKFAFGMAGTALLLCLPVLIAWLVLLVFFLTEGKRGPNRFGPDPKGEALNDTP